MGAANFPRLSDGREVCPVCRAGAGRGISFYRLRPDRPALQRDSCLRALRTAAADAGSDFSLLFPAPAAASDRRTYRPDAQHSGAAYPAWRGGTAHAERGSQPEDRLVKVLGAEIDFPTLLADTAPAISPAPFVRRYSNGRAFQLAIVKILIEQIEHLRYLQNDYIFKDIFYFCESQLTHHRLKSKL